MTVPTLADMIRRAKDEIRADVANGTLPKGIRSFSELHDYVDANVYGGLCDGLPVDGDTLVTIGNALQEAVGAWLAAGMPDDDTTTTEEL